jgi:hypothetical protein
MSYRSVLFIVALTGAIDVLATKVVDNDRRNFDRSQGVVPEFDAEPKQLEFSDNTKEASQRLFRFRAEKPQWRGRDERAGDSRETHDHESHPLP